VCPVYGPYRPSQAVLRGEKYPPVYPLFSPAFVSRLVSTTYELEAGGIDSSEKPF
jgi:hypothetical protein